MTQPDPLKHLEPLLKRMDLLCRAAGNLPADAPRNERLRLILELELGRQAIRSARKDLRERIARTHQTRTATHAYGRAQMLSANHR